MHFHQDETKMKVMRRGWKPLKETKNLQIVTEWSRDGTKIHLKKQNNNQAFMLILFFCNLFEIFVVFLFSFRKTHEHICRLFSIEHAAKVQTILDFIHVYWICRFSNMEY